MGEVTKFSVKLVQVCSFGGLATLNRLESVYVACSQTLYKLRFILSLAGEVSKCSRLYFKDAIHTPTSRGIICS